MTTGPTLQELLDAEKTAESDQTRKNDFKPATHVCGSEGEVDWYWRVASCFSCGVVPCGEMK